MVCFCPGEAKNTYGTGCFLLAHTGRTPIESRHGLLTTIVAGEAGRPIEYALEGSVFVGGAVIRWLRDEMKLIHETSDSEYFARKVADSGGVYFVPAFTGLGAPSWDMHARGTVLGLTAGTGKNHIIRAALEAIALGAAFLAGLGVGFYRDREELRACVFEGKHFSPEMPPALLEAKLRGWHRAVAACRAFTAEEE